MYRSTKFLVRRVGSRAFSTPKPIQMSYVSYENTQSYNADGPRPIIVMHGLLGSRTNWNSLCKTIHKRTDPQRRVIAVDARNHGDSPHSEQHTYPHLCEDVRELFDHLKIAKGTLVGHSMGGRALMYFALKYPQLVEKLIVVDISPVRSSASLSSALEILTIMSEVRLPTSGPIAAARLNADMQLAKKLNDKALRNFILTNLIRKADGSYGWRVNLPALIANQTNITTFPRDSLQYKGPVLFIGGGASDFLTKEDHPGILELFPKAEFVYIDGAGHWLHSEKPNEFLQLCVDFFNTNTS